LTRSSFISTVVPIPRDFPQAQRRFGTGRHCSRRCSGVVALGLVPEIEIGRGITSDVFIGGVIDTDFGLLKLVRGDFEPITVPLSIFRPSGTSTPTFTRFELADYGHSIRFGEYEASAHFILYETDADYRKRMKKKQRAEESSFGASLRRLRVLRGDRKITSRNQ